MADSNMVLSNDEEPPMALLKHPLDPDNAAIHAVFEVKQDDKGHYISIGYDVLRKEDSSYYEPEGEEKEACDAQVQAFGNELMQSLSNFAAEEQSKNDGRHS